MQTGLGGTGKRVSIQSEKRDKESIERKKIESREKGKKAGRERKAARKRVRCRKYPDDASLTDTRGEESASSIRLGK